MWNIFSWNKNIPMGGVNHNSITYIFSKRMWVNRTWTKCSYLNKWSHQISTTFFTVITEGDVNILCILRLKRNRGQCLFLKSFKIPQTRAIISSCHFERSVPMSVNINTSNVFWMHIRYMTISHWNPWTIRNFLHNLYKLIQVFHSLVINRLNHPTKCILWRELERSCTSVHKHSFNG